MNDEDENEMSELQCYIEECRGVGVFPSPEVIAEIEGISVSEAWSRMVDDVCG